MPRRCSSVGRAAFQRFQSGATLLYDLTWVQIPVPWYKGVGKIKFLAVPSGKQHRNSGAQNGNVAKKRKRLVVFNDFNLNRLKSFQRVFFCLSGA